MEEMQFFYYYCSAMSIDSFVTNYGLLADEVTELAKLIDSRSSAD